MLYATTSASRSIAQHRPAGMPIYFGAGDPPILYHCAAKLGRHLAEDRIDEDTVHAVLRVLAGDHVPNYALIHACWWATDVRLDHERAMHQAERDIIRAVRPLFAARAHAAHRANAGRLHRQHVYWLLCDESRRGRRAA